jgi:LCP family protein required for cell wall assembly
LRPGATLRTPAGAAFLSFLLPGLGLFATGRRRRGLVVASPAIAITVALALVILFDRHAIYGALVSEMGATWFLLLDVAVGLYRVWAIVDTYLAVSSAGSSSATGALTLPETAAAPARRFRLSRNVNAVILGIVVVATTGTHLAVGAIDLDYRDQLTCIFNPDVPCWFGGNGNLAANETAPPMEDETAAPDDASASMPADTATDTPDDTPTDTAAPSAGASATPSPSPTPRVTLGPTTAAGIPIFPIESVGGPNTPPAQWADDGYLNLLLVGVDQGVGRWSLRPDTMILLRVEIYTGRSVMFGIPRNLENVPLPPESAKAFPCHCFPYPNLLNGLWRDAVNRPKAYPYPGTDFVRGFKALEGAVGQYLGLHVDGAVVVNLMGFVHVVDALGGLDINVPAALRDTHYARPQDGRFVTISIKAGQQHMNGYTALAYARSRHQDSDYGRMGRQQAVLLALRAQLHPCELVPKIPSLIKTLGQAFWTDMPMEDATALAGLAEQVGTGNVKSIELVPKLTGNPVGFLNIPRLANVRYIVAHGLDRVTPAGGGAGSGGGFGC